MGLEGVLTLAVAVLVPVWLVVEQVLMRRRSTEGQRTAAESADHHREVAGKEGLRPAALLPRLPRKAA